MRIGELSCLARTLEILPIKAAASGLGLILNGRGEAALMEGISVDIRLCVVGLRSLCEVNRLRSPRPNLFVVSPYAPTD